MTQTSRPQRYQAAARRLTFTSVRPVANLSLTKGGSSGGSGGTTDAMDVANGANGSDDAHGTARTVTVRRDECT